MLIFIILLLFIIIIIFIKDWSDGAEITGGGANIRGAEPYFHHCIGLAAYYSSPLTLISFTNVFIFHLNCYIVWE
jgi:hypothetical protein